MWVISILCRVISQTNYPTQCCVGSGLVLQGEAHKFAIFGSRDHYMNRHAVSGYLTQYTYRLTGSGRPFTESLLAARRACIRIQQQQQPLFQHLTLGSKRALVR